MRFLSVCSGIEAASVAWNPLGWEAAMFAEIEPFPCSVLAHHYPTVPNRGDMTKFEDWPDESIDLLCGGTPCQSFSVAGLRKGLDDPRGNLMLTYGAIAAKHRPRWLVWENVPGVLSSNAGRDFGSFLGLLGQLGYGFAYRVLDAQHFGVPQRRRRVFVVGCLGDWRSAAAVLFERHSLSGHPAPSRQAGERVAPTLAGCANGGGANGPGRDADSADSLIPMRARALTTSNQRIDAETETFIVTHALTGEGFDASEDGTGRGTPLMPVSIHENQRGEFSFNTTAGSLGRGGGKPGQGYQAIAFDCKSSGQNGFGIGVELAGTQRAMGHANSHTNGGGHQAVQTGMQVRRLTPRECERLQGFPDSYTAVPHRGKPAADGPRYKALGNSWAVPCAAWIGWRIAAVDTLQTEQERTAA